MNTTATPTEATVLQSILDAAGVPFTADDQDAIYAVGRLLYDRGEHHKAADVFRLLALLVPLRSRSWASLAACHEAFGDAERARALYGLALEVSEHDNHRPVAAAYKARLDLDAADEEGAVAALEQFDRELADPAVCNIADDVERSLGRARL